MAPLRQHACPPPTYRETTLPPWAGWFGQDPGWRRPFEGNTLKVKAGQLTVTERDRGLVYEHTGLHVPGRRDRVPIRIEFWAEPGPTYGMAPEDYPYVFADTKPSPHRLPNGALCLYYPWDFPWRRYQSRINHLDGLLELVRDHLFAEDYWRTTGGQRRGRWALEEAPHGFPRAGAA